MGKVITIAQQKGGSGKTTLAVNLAVALARMGHSVALLDTDPQGSLGRWFMARRACMATPDVDLATASAWGVSCAGEKLRKTIDFVIVDVPPKVDADLRPALREAGLILIPVAASHVDLWAVEGVLDLASPEHKRTTMVLNRTKAGTHLGEKVALAAAECDAGLAVTRLGQRVVFAKTLGTGLGVLKAGRSTAGAEVQALAEEVLALLQADGPLTKSIQKA